MEHNRGSWGSNTGFLLAAIGSAVGLGNIWSFPYKMGRCGGFLFFILYLLLSVFVGFVIMAGELAMGRKTGRGAVGAYHALSKRFRWVGWLAVFSPFVVMGFYAVLGGYCMEYMVLNLSHLVIPGMQSQRGAEAFQMMLSHPMRSLISMLAFMAVCYLISRSGVSGGIERFNKVGMPALFGMLAIMIVRSLSLPNAMEGLKFMFLPGYAVEAGFIQQAPGFASILATAGGQMFFSLSLAMGAMITYGSYLGKGENLAKNAGIIVTADAIVATLAGVAVIPAAIANGIVEIRSGATVLDAATGRYSVGWAQPAVRHTAGCVPLHGRHWTAVRNDLLFVGSDCRHFLRSLLDGGGYRLFPGPLCRAWKTGKSTCRGGVGEFGYRGGGSCGSCGWFRHQWTMGALSKDLWRDRGLQWQLAGVYERCIRGDCHAVGSAADEPHGSLGTPAKDAPGRDAPGRKSKD